MKYGRIYTNFETVPILSYKLDAHLRIIEVQRFDYIIQSNNSCTIWKPNMIQLAT